MNLQPFQPGLPLPADSSAPAGPGIASHAQEWQRAFDRAQARAWQHADAPGEAGASSGAAGGRPPLDAEGSSNPAGVKAANERTARAGGSRPLALHAPTPVDLASPGTAAARNLHGAARWTGVAAVAAQHCGEQPVTDAPATSAAFPAAARDASAHAENAAALARRPVMARPTAAPSQVRVHVEAGAEGLQVWIGLPGEPAAIALRTAALLAELRRCGQEADQRIAFVVCNGRAVLGTAPAPAEPVHRGGTA